MSLESDYFVSLQGSVRSKAVHSARQAIQAQTGSLGEDRQSLLAHQVAHLFGFGLVFL